MTLSVAKQHHLVFVYVTQGYSAAKPLAILYGVNPRHISKYTRASGIKGKPGRQRTKQPKPKRSDHLWQRAIGRGSISR